MNGIGLFGVCATGAEKSFGQPFGTRRPCMREHGNGKQTLFSVSVGTIEGFNPTDATFSPPADAILERRGTGPQVSGQSDEVTGSLVKKTVPVYPLASKMNREQGVVLLAAVIGTDGMINDL